MARKKQFRTSVLIDDDKHPDDDLAFITARKLKPTNLLRAKIKELRQVDEGGSSVEKLQENIGFLREKLEQVFEFLNEEGLLGKFQKKQNI